jgi:YEATS family
VNLRKLKLRPKPPAMSSNERVRVRVNSPVLFNQNNAFLLIKVKQGVTVHRPIIYGNTATVLTPEEKASLTFPDHTHRWTVAVRSAASAADSDIVGGADDLGYFIKRVAFKLHDTYPNPTRSELSF